MQRVILLGQTGIRGYIKHRFPMLFLFLRGIKKDCRDALEPRGFVHLISFYGNIIFIFLFFQFFSYYYLRYI